MENQDKLYEQFKGAAEKAEGQGFARMEAVWNRVEEKLDYKKQRRIATWWKYTGMAAVLALFITIGTFLYRENTPDIGPQGMPENNITVIDTQKIKSTFDPVKENAATEAVVINAKDDNEAVKRFVPYKEQYVYDTLAPGRNFNRALPTPQKQSFAHSPMEEKESQAKAKYYTTSKDFSAEAAITAPAVADSGTIAFTGTITDSQGMPIPGVTVTDGKGKNVQTDFDGKYTININEGDKLVASYIGMQNNSILGFMSNNNATLKMNDDTVALSDVVVNSYRNTASVSNAAITSIAPKSFETAKGFTPSVDGTIVDIDEGKVKKRERTYKDGIDVKTANDKNLTGVQPSVATAASKTIEESPNASFVQSLQGQVAGLNIASESTSGNDSKCPPGLAQPLPKNPLYVIDGVPVNEGNFNINPTDIISITVLKDAAATSIYGYRGASGVIIIKTKNGLTKRELRKLKREQRRAAKKQAITKSQ